MRSLLLCSTLLLLACSHLVAQQSRPTRGSNDDIPEPTPVSMGAPPPSMPGGVDSLRRAWSLDLSAPPAAPSVETYHQLVSIGDGLLLNGNALLAQQVYDNAATLMSQLIDAAASPLEKARLFRQRTAVNLDLGQYTTAMFDAREMITTLGAAGDPTPETGEAHLLMARALAQLGRLNEALHHLTVALDNNILPTSDPSENIDLDPLKATPRYRELRLTYGF